MALSGAVRAAMAAGRGQDAALEVEPGPHSRTRGRAVLLLLPGCLHCRNRSPHLVLETRVVKLSKGHPPDPRTGGRVASGQQGEGDGVVGRLDGANPGATDEGLPAQRCPGYQPPVQSSHGDSLARKAVDVSDARAVRWVGLTPDVGEAMGRHEMGEGAGTRLNSTLGASVIRANIIRGLQDAVPVPPKQEEAPLVRGR